MNNNQLSSIIEQALNNSDFRQQLIKNPQVALERYNLSREDLEVLQMALQGSEESSEAESVETRSSPWAINSLNLGGH
jgi:hypothetical protein